MIRPRITCKLCGGHGQREIDTLHWETFQQLSSSWVSTGAIESAHKPALRRTTLVERLNWLARAGLVEGAKNGTGMKWRRIDRDPPPITADDIAQAQRESEALHKAFEARTKGMERVEERRRR